MQPALKICYLDFSQVWAGFALRKDEADKRYSSENSD